MTFSARLGTIKYIDSLGILMHPLDDYFNSGKVVDAGASIVLPLPGTDSAAPSQEARTSLP